MQASFDPTIGQVEITPLTLVTRSFPTRPSALPDIRDFVRRQLNQTTLSDDEVRTLCDRVAAVLLDAAGVFGSIQVSLRIFPRYAEVDVLVAADGGEESGISRGVGAGPAPADRPEVLQSPAALPASAVDGSGEAAPTVVSFADWLAGSLRREGMTLEAAARRLGVSVKTVSRWVGGSTEPRLRDLSRIRETFGEFPFF